MERWRDGWKEERREGGVKGEREKGKGRERKGTKNGIKCPRRPMRLKDLNFNSKPFLETSKCVFNLLISELRPSILSHFQMCLSLAAVIIESALKSWLSSTALKLKFSTFQLQCVVLSQYFG